ncbi:hypothetical protein [Sphingomonas baiyangensis]|uniref:hypothetical protein n=1 Tax=Sphingomonas baiyangensis TaxID=2572576 RepID=UPI00146CD7EF|nr:hypothetical protein [Sphingomonas baiyangensis]
MTEHDKAMWAFHMRSESVEYLRGKAYAQPPGQEDAMAILARDELCRRAVERAQANPA